MSVRTADGIVHEHVTVTGSHNAGKPYLVAFCDLLMSLDDPVAAERFRANSRVWHLNEASVLPATCLMCMGEMLEVGK